MDVWKVVDRLEVELQDLQPRYLVAMFRMESQKNRKEITFMVEYTEDVFDPENKSHQNIASMIAIQPAFNYGLFAKDIVFHGLFDDLDRRMVRRQGEMVAKEVYFNRMVEPHLYLINAVKDQPLPQSKGLLKASLTLTEKGHANTTVPWTLWDTYKDRCAVYVSGSAESALTLGVLDEMGKKVYPMWMEEKKEREEPISPLLAHMIETYPNAKRILSNHQGVDRWFHENIPLLRPIEELQEAGIPPWGVWSEVSLTFCMLPLIKKYQIGRMVLGQNFYTTQKEFAHRQSFSHHMGLYERSYYQDVAQSRYLQQKGWSLNQFSIIRPLSGLLTEKILLERYPTLYQKVQGCTQPREGSKGRCGWCDSCRRNIVYLLALEVKPQDHGYDDTHIKYALKTLLDERTSLEEEELEQLFPLLRRQNKIDAVPKRYAHNKTPISILSPRFTRERSPINAIPNDLREPVLRIFLQHAKTALVRLGRGWSEFDPFANDQFYTPYPFEIHTEEIPLDTPKLMPLAPRKSQWGELTWLELKKQTESTNFAILPIGAITQHGPHLPLDTSNYLLQELINRALISCSFPPPLVLPLLPFGVAYHHSDFPGTIDIHNETLVRLVYEIGVSLSKNDIKKLLILNGHVGNKPALNDAAQQINRDTGIFVFVDSGESSQLDLLKLIETPNDIHAGELETSLCLAVRPQMVQTSLARSMIPKLASRYLNFTSQRSVPWHTRIKQVSYNGVIGDPTKASTEKGEQFWHIILLHTVALLEDIKALSLEELASTSSVLPSSIPANGASTPLPSPEKENPFPIPSLPLGNEEDEDELYQPEITSKFDG